MRGVKALGHDGPIALDRDALIAKPQGFQQVFDTGVGGQAVPLAIQGNVQHSHLKPVQGPYPTMGFLGGDLLHSIPPPRV